MGVSMYGRILAVFFIVYRIFFCYADQLTGFSNPLYQGEDPW